MVRNGEKMKKFIPFLFLILFCGCLNNSDNIDKIHDKPKNKLNINNFWVYYGSNNIEKLSKYDLVIIEPYNYKKEDIQKLKSLNPNIKVIAYLSIGEVDKDRNYFKECQKIIIGKDQNWNSYYVNVSSPIWQKIILDEVKKFKDMGFDGVFLDTVDSAIYTNQKKEVIELIKKIRKENPNIIIIQNRGFEVVDKTSPYIDGVLFEDFTTTYNFESKKACYWEGNDLNWVNSQAEKLKSLREKYNLIILTLDYVSDDEMAKRCIEHAEQYDFIPMVTKDIYLNTIN
jgi:uncharacterized protein (TIGR01370 family)